MRSEITRRDALVGGGAAVAAIFGGRLVAPASHPYHVAIRPGTAWGDHVAFGLCGGTHIGGGWVVSAAHCGAIGEDVLVWRIGGIEVSPLVLVPRGYDRAGLIYDVMLARVPELADLPALPLASAADYVALRAATPARAAIIGDGTTGLDAQSRPDRAAQGLREMPVDILEATAWRLVVASADGRGGACVGDSGSACIWRGKIVGVTSNVPADPATLLPCQGETWRATYASLEAHLPAIRAIVASGGQA